MKLRTRIFLGISLLSLGTIGLTLLAASAFLEPFYLAQKSNQLEQIARRIGKLPSDVSEKARAFAEIEGATSVHITVVASGGAIAYDTNAPSGYAPPPNADMAPPPGGMIDIAPPPGGSAPPGQEGRPPPFVPEPPEGRRGAADRLPIAAREAQGLGQGRVVFETEDKSIGVKLLILSDRQESGARLILSFPIAQASESARLAMAFLAASSAVALALGAVMSCFFARSVTRPFVELTEISRSLAALDFSRRFGSKRNDEVAVLGDSMNELSDSLERALAELGETNARLREDVEREKRIDAMRREFVSSVSHELKTPLALIIGFAEGLREGVASDQATREDYMDVIVDEARKMDGQVRDLLELSQLESGLVPLGAETTDLGELAREALSSFGFILRDREVEPVLRISGSAVLVADPDKIRRAIVNFLANAISHLDVAGVLEIEVQALGPGSGGKCAGGAALSVFNSGAPIPEASLELIWNSYYRVDGSRSREFGGTGLGLAIVRGIVARHGGECSAENLGATESRPAGVRFAFRLPPVAPMGGPFGGASAEPSEPETTT